MALATAKKVIAPNVGMSDEQRQSITDMLKRTLADQHILYMKLRNYHWNVTGPQFHALHELFEEQYDELAEAIDETAERIRQYGTFAPGTFQEMLEYARLSEQPGDVPAAREMVENLVADHETFIRQLREDTDVVGGQLDDVAIEDYYTQMIQDHQEMAWMLRAFLEGESL